MGLALAAFGDSQTGYERGGTARAGEYAALGQNGLARAGGARPHLARVHTRIQLAPAMTDETPKPPKSFSLRALSKAEIQKLEQDKSDALIREREAKRPHPTNLILIDRVSGNPVPGGYIKTRGWVWDDEQINDEFVALKRMMGPEIPKEQKIPTRGFDPGRFQDLEEFLGDEMKAGSETVRLCFFDPIPQKP